MNQIVIPVLRSFDQAQVEAFYFGFLGFVQDWSHQFAPDLPLYQQISLPSRRGQNRPRKAKDRQIRGMAKAH